MTISLQIFDVAGRNVAFIFDNATLTAGEYTVRWRADGMPAGIYFYRLTAENGYSQTRRMVLIK